MSAATDAIPMPSSPAGSEALTSAATAAAAAMPSPSTLLLGPTDGSLTPDGQGSAVLAGFTGAVSGSLAIIVDPALETALAAAAEGGLPVAEAVRPALEAASAAIGPAVLTAPESLPAAALVARTDFTWAPLVGDGEVLVWVGLALTPPQARAGAAPVRRTEVGSLNLLRDVEMTLTVELGRASMLVRDLLSLAPGSVIELDRAAGAPADLMVNGRLLARGEIVVVDEDYGLRITEIVDPGGEG
jgi:flagellar motor switch protein FliN/FliY